MIMLVPLNKGIPANKPPPLQPQSGLTILFNFILIITKLFFHSKRFKTFFEVKSLFS
jgi:hypothetical protein